MSEEIKSKAERRALAAWTRQDVSELSERKTDCSLGVNEATRRIEFVVGDACLELTADEADELATDLRGFAIELRNGGRTA